MQPQELTPMPETQLRGLTEREVAARSSQGLTNALPVKTSWTYVQIIGENVFTPINNILFAMGLVSVLLISLSPLRSLFDLALLNWPNFLVIALYVVIWVFLVRWVWR